MSIETTKSLDKLLHATGRRMTPQRRTVLKILEASETHLDAEGIWKCAKSYNPSSALIQVTIFKL